MGAWEEIVDYTVPSNTTSVTLNNFGTITKDDFIKIHMTHVNPNTSLNSFVSVLGNSSIRTNYHFQRLTGNGSTVSANRLDVNDLFGTTPNITSTNFAYFKLSENDRLNLFANNFIQNNSGIFTEFKYATSSGATFTSGITSLTFQTDINNGIGANSRIQIYRLAAQKVADITVASNTTQVDITGLDIKKGDEYLLVSYVNPISSALTYLTVNNNTTASNYYSQQIIGTGSTAVAGRTNQPLQTSIIASESSSMYSHIKLSNIGAYTSQNYAIRSAGTSGLVLYNSFISSTAENITSISALNIVSTVNNAIGSGTRFELYKLYEGGN